MADLEFLAAAEHESWSGWTKWMLRQIEKEIQESYGQRKRGERSNRDRAAKAAVDSFNALPCVLRWKRQMITPYLDLSEKEKESDRKEAREKIKVYQS